MVYLNPVNAINSFLIVYNPVSNIIAKRNDIVMETDLFPSKVSTFNSIIYNSYIFRDQDKINKVWPYNDFYTNSYGFGDVSITVSVGGIKKTKPSLEPGNTTYAKIVFYNNCGFDWNMKGNAIYFKYEGSKKINANDLVREFVHSIKVPLKYNFLNYVVEKEYSEYISIKPSDHNKDVASEFFDFQNINVVTIRDGFKGEYYLKIDVDKSFPDNLRGKPIEIKIELNTTYFDHFPGDVSDPIRSYHQYNVKIPSIYIAVPFKDGEFSGKVLYTSAQSHNISIEYQISVD